MTATEAEARLSTRWAWVIYRGVVAVLFGLLAFVRASAASLMLVLVFGAYSFAGGIAAVVTSLRQGPFGESRDLLLLDGAVGLCVATLSLFWPLRLPIVAEWIVGGWAIVMGAIEIMYALRLRRALENEWSLELAGAASISFGVMLLGKAMAAESARAGSVGAWAVAFGALTIALGVRLRSFFIHAHGGGRQMPRLYVAR
jgi:uncharacterized membrane protein HdeD (DUF308 family)